MRKITVLTWGPISKGHNQHDLCLNGQTHQFGGMDPITNDPLTTGRHCQICCRPLIKGKKIPISRQSVIECCIEGAFDDQLLAFTGDFYLFTMYGCSATKYGEHTLDFVNEDWEETHMLGPDAVCRHCGLRAELLLDRLNREKYIEALTKNDCLGNPKHA